MKSWIKKWWGLCIIMTALIAVPFIINAAYMIGADKPNTVFTESDMLSIYATISSVLATTIGIYVAYQGIVMTINHNQELENEVRRNNVLPIIVSDEIMRERSKQDLLALSISALEPEHIASEEMPYMEYALNEFAFVFSEDNDLSIFPHLTTEQKLLIKQPLIPEVNSENTNMRRVRFRYNQALYLPIMLTNAGLGVAMCLRISLVGTGIQKTSYPVNIGKDKSIRITFFAEDAKCANGDYELHIVYRDVYNNEYLQKHELSFNDGAYEYSPIANQTRKDDKEDTNNER